MSHFLRRHWDSIFINHFLPPRAALAPPVKYKNTTKNREQTDVRSAECKVRALFVM
jgi:hypothetical protein